MATIDANSTLNIKLNVKPVVFTMYHINAYMGPCRYGEGHALTTEHDIETSNRSYEDFKKEVAENLDMRNVNLLEPVLIHWNEDFVIRESEMQKAMADDCRTDYYLVRGLRMSSHFAVQLALRTNKPVGFTNPSTVISNVEHVDMTARLWALGRRAHAFMDWDDINQTFAVLRTKKALANTKVLFPLKSAVLSVGCQSSYLTLEHITQRFGTRFGHINSDEVFQWLDALGPEEKQEALDLADRLAGESAGMHMPKEYLANDTAFYVTTKKLMRQHDCNAFTIPCFEICATRELQKRKLTFCLTHSLLKDEGLASSCAGDAGSILSITILINLARMAPYMGNTMVVDRKANQCRILHDVSCARMKGYDEPALPVEYVSFTMENWGATMRYDFARDNGATITLVNLSPDMKKIMVARGTINGCDNYLVPECKHAVRFTVADATHFHRCESHVGHHFAMVYGDHVEKVVQFGRECDLEVLEA